jgi:hypothetical protein
LGTCSNGLNFDQNNLEPSFEGHNKFLISQNKSTFPASRIPLKSIQILTKSTVNKEINLLEIPTELVKHFPLPNQLIQGHFHTNHFKVL